jgi:hypothetical protein
VSANDDALIGLRSTIASVNEAILQPIQETKDLYGFNVPPETLALIDRLCRIVGLSNMWLTTVDPVQASTNQLSEYLAKSKIGKFGRRDEIKDIVDRAKEDIDAAIKRFMVCRLFDLSRDRISEHRRCFAVAFCYLN